MVQFMCFHCTYLIILYTKKENKKCLIFLKIFLKKVLNTRATVGCVRYLLKIYFGFRDHNYQTKYHGCHPASVVFRSNVRVCALASLF